MQLKNKILIVMAYSLLLTAYSYGQENNHIFVERASTTYLKWDAAGDYTSYDSLYFVVKPCTSNTCARLIQKKLATSYTEPYTTGICTLYVDETASFNAAKYYYSIYAYGADTVFVTSGNFNLMLNGQTPADGIATSTPYYTVALDTPYANNVFPVGMDSDNVWYQKNVAQVRSILGVDTAGGTSASLDSLYTKTSHIVKIEEFGGVGDGVTDNSIAFSAAYNSFGDDGGTIILDAKTYVINDSSINVTDRKPVMIQGQGWSSLVSDVFGNAQWLATNAIQGTVIKVTGSEGGIRIDGALYTKKLLLKDLAILGTGTGTAIGIYMGAAGSTLENTLSNVMIANFATGLYMNNTLDNTFYDLTIVGCTNGIFVNETTDMNFYRTNIQRCDTAMNIESGALFNFYGGLIQSNTLGILIHPVPFSMIGWHFYGFWFESNVVAIELNPSDNAMSEITFTDCRAGGATDSVVIKGTLGTIARLSMINCYFPTYINLDGVTTPTFIGGYSGGLNLTGAVNPIILNSTDITYTDNDSIRVHGRSYLDSISAVHNAVVLEDELQLLNKLNMSGDADIDSMKIDSDDSLRFYISGRMGDFVTLGVPHDHRVFGAELVTNGGFADSTDWTFEGGANDAWSVSGGVLSCDGSNYYGENVNQVPGGVGNLYKLEYDLTVTQGYVGFKIGSAGQYTNRYTSGHFKEFQTALGNGGLTIAAFIDSSDTSAFIGTIDNISMMLVLSSDSTIPGNRHISPVNLLNPTTDDTLFVGKYNTRRIYDSLAVFDIQDSIAIQIFYDDGSSNDLITTVDTLTAGDNTIVFDVTDIPIDSKVYMYFVFLGDTEAYLRSQIYWRD